MGGNRIEICNYLLKKGFAKYTKKIAKYTTQFLKDEKRVFAKYTTQIAKYPKKNFMTKIAQYITNFFKDNYKFLFQRCIFL